MFKKTEENMVMLSRDLEDVFFKICIRGIEIRPQCFKLKNAESVTNIKLEIKEKISKFEDIPTEITKNETVFQQNISELCTTSSSLMYV